MKKVTTCVLITFFLILTLTHSVEAEGNKGAECPVYAKCHSSNIEFSKIIIKNGNASVTDKDGLNITIIIDNTTYDGYNLVVHSITESDAFDWVKSCVPSDIEEFSAYDIYLLNPENERVELPDNTLVQISDSNQEKFVMGLSCSGTISLINIEYENEKLKFNSSKEVNYYLICSKVDNSIVDNNIPQTGDKSKIYLLIVMLCAMMTPFIIRRYRNRRRGYRQG